MRLRACFVLSIVLHFFFEMSSRELLPIRYVRVCCSAFSCTRGMIGRDILMLSR